MLATSESVDSFCDSGIRTMGALTYVPDPWRDTTAPARASSSMARRTVSRLTPRSSASRASLGSLSPGP